MKDGQARYSPMCNEEGGVVDDLIAYRRATNEFFLVVVNAANKDKDYKWMEAPSIRRCRIEDISDTVGQIALQDPRQRYPRTGVGA